MRALIFILLMTVLASCASSGKNGETADIDGLLQLMKSQLPQFRSCFISFIDENTKTAAFDLSAIVSKEGTARLAVANGELNDNLLSCLAASVFNLKYPVVPSQEYSYSAPMRYYAAKDPASERTTTLDAKVYKEAISKSPLYKSCLSQAPKDTMFIASLSIARNGKVKKVRMLGENVSSPSKCVKTSLNKLIFPKTHGQVSLIFRYGKPKT